MTIEINDPATAKFIKEQLESGPYRTADDLVNAAFLTWMASERDLDDELDPAELAALRRSIQQAESGQTISLDEAARRLGITIDRKQGRSGAA